MSDQPTTTEIVAAIKRSGYLMEQEVASTLEFLGFHVETNRAFEDVDEAKSREIDVWAFKYLHKDQTNNFHLTIEMLCECKNNTNPFIFITRPKNRKDKDHPTPEEFRFPIEKYERVISRLPDGNIAKTKIVPAFQRLNWKPHVAVMSTKIGYVLTSIWRPRWSGRHVRST